VRPAKLRFRRGSGLHQTSPKNPVRWKSEIRFWPFKTTCFWRKVRCRVEERDKINNAYLHLRHALASQHRLVHDHPPTHQQDVARDISLRTGFGGRSGQGYDVAGHETVARYRPPLPATIDLRTKTVLAAHAAVFESSENKAPRNVRRDQGVTARCVK